MKYTMLFLMFGLVCLTAAWAFDNTIPNAQSALAVASVNGGDAEAVAVRSQNRLVMLLRDALTLLGGCNLLIALAAVVRYAVRRCKTPAAVAVLLAFASLSLPSCVKPYLKPVFEEIQPHETAYMFPFEGDTGAQTKFASEEFLEQHKVAAKRLEIPHRWVQEGRLGSTGRWIPSVRVLKIDRTPVTREWEAETTKGTGNKDEAIWVESRDSVGFCMGYTCTAYVQGPDTSKFLFWYPNGALAKVMDTEIRGRVLQAAADFAAGYDLDALRAKKKEMMASIKEDVVAFFAQRGITITTLGMSGGMTYENPAIQKSIDEVFVAQQKKLMTLAAFEAQQKANDTMTLEATGKANALRQEADGKAYFITKEAEALAQAQSTPLYGYLQLLKTWDGKFPVYYMGGGSPASLLMQLPPAPTAAAASPAVRPAAPSPEHP